MVEVRAFTSINQFTEKGMRLISVPLCSVASKINIAFKILKPFVKLLSFKLGQSIYRLQMFSILFEMFETVQG